MLVLVPKIRRPLIRTVVSQVKGFVPKLLEALSQPARLTVSAGSSLLLNVGYITAFVASLSAVGAHPPILATAVVYIVAGFVGAATPTPGGLGGVWRLPWSPAWSVLASPRGPCHTRGGRLPLGHLLVAHTGRMAVVPGSATVWRVVRELVARSAPATAGI